LDLVRTVTTVFTRFNENPFKLELSQDGNKFKIDGSESTLDPSYPMEFVCVDASSNTDLLCNINFLVGESYSSHKSDLILKYLVEFLSATANYNISKATFKKGSLYLTVSDKLEDKEVKVDYLLHSVKCIILIFLSLVGTRTVVIESVGKCLTNSQLQMLLYESYFDVVESYMLEVENSQYRDLLDLIKPNLVLCFNEYNLQDEFIYLPWDYYILDNRKTWRV
jgi:hypothetical protein